MGLSHSPSVVTGGLVLYLDPANDKSYGGSKTGTTWIDPISGGILNLQNGMSFSNSNLGIFNLDGVDDYASITRGDIGGSSAFTVSAWIKASTITKYSGAVSFGTSGSGKSAYIGTVGVAQAGSTNSIGGGFYGFNVGTGVTSLNTWFMLTFTYGGGSNGTISFYLNDSLSIAATYNSEPSIDTSNFSVGRIATDTTYNFHGSVSAVMCYNRSIQLPDIKKNFKALRGRFGL